MKIALISTPRTGSFWLYSILKTYLEEKNPDAVSLEEYFDVGYLLHAITPSGLGQWRQIHFDEFHKFPDRWCRDFIWNQNRIEPILRPYSNEMVRRSEALFRAGLMDNYMTTVSRQRLEWLKNDSRTDIVLKIHAEDLARNPDLLEHLARHFKIILLRRRDRVKQIWSWCAAQGTGIFSRNGRSARPLEYEFKPEWLDQILYHLTIFEDLRSRLQGRDSVHDVCYEDLVELRSPKAILAKFGLAPEKDIWNSVLDAQPETERQPAQDVRNAGEFFSKIARAKDTGFRSTQRPSIILRVPKTGGEPGEATSLCFDPNSGHMSESPTRTNDL
ncbi:MAG: hypothetical protein ABL958_09100 [Bdellovibrionia bacterium]